MANEKKIVYEFYAEIKDVLAKFKELEAQGAASFNKVGQESKNASEKIKSAFQTLNVRPFAQIEADIKKVQQAYETLRQSGTLSARELANAHQAMQQKVTGLKNEMAGLTQQTGYMAQQMLLLKGILATAVFTFFTRETFAQFGEFDKQIRNVWTLTDATEERMGQFGDQLKDVAKGLPVSASELTKATYDLVSAGASLDDSVGIVEMASKAAIAGLTDTQTAAKVGIGVMNSYGLSINDLGKVYDSLFNLVKSGVTTFEEISQYIGQVSTIASSTGVGLNELNATLAILTKSNIKFPQAVTGVKSAILSLVQPSEQTIKALEDAKITWKGLIPTLEALKAKGYTTAESLAKLNLPKESLNTFITAIKNIDALKASMNEFESSSGVMEEAYKKNAGSFENQTKLMTTAFQDLAATIGEDMAIVVLPLIQALTLLIQKFSELPDPVRQAIELFVGFNLAIKAIMTAKALLGIPAALGAAGVAFTSFGASVAAASNLMMASFLGVVALTATALGGLIISISSYKKELADAFKFSPDFSAEAAAFEQYKDFKVKSNEELKNLDEAAMQEYGNSLAKKRAYLNNTIAKLTKEEQSPFNVLFGRDKAKEKAELQKQLDATEQQMKDLIAKRAGIEAEIGILVKPQAQTKESELQIQELVQKRQEMLEQEKQKHIEIQELNASHLQSLLGIDMTEEQILAKINESSSATEAKNAILKESVKLNSDENTTVAVKAAMLERTSEIVDEIFKVNENVAKIEGVQLALNEGKVEAITAAEAALESYKGAAEEAIGIEGSVAGFDVLQEKIGLVVNQANEMYAILEGKSIKINVEDGNAAFEKMATLTEKQKVEFLNATGSVKIMGTAIDDAAGKMKNMQDSTKDTAEEMKNLAEKTPKVEFEPEISEKGLEKTADAFGKSAAQMKDDLQNAMDAVRDLAEVQIVPEGFDVGKQEAQLQELIESQQAQKEELATQITEAQAKRAEIEGEIAALTASFATVQQNLTTTMTTAMAQMAVAMQQSFNMETIMAAFATLQEFLTTISVSIQTMTATVVTNIQTIYAAEQAAAQTYVAERSALFSAAGAEIVGMAGEFVSQIETVYQAAVQRAREAAAAISDLNSQVAQAGTGGSAPGFATGGIVRGRSGRDKIHAMLTADEFVVQKAAVKKYGVGFLHALNKGLLDFRSPTFKAAQLSMPANDSIRMTKGVPRFATGGLVKPVNQVNATTRAKIVNLIDPNLLTSQMASRKGEQVILNIIKANSRLVKDIIS